MILEKLDSIGKGIANFVKCRYRAIAAVVIIVLTAVLVALCIWGLFSIQHVRKIVIKGECAQYTEEMLISMSGIEYGQLLFSTDTDEVEKTLLERAPYLSEVKVSCRFFSKIVIEIKADTPKYYIRIADTSKEVYLLSEEMRVIDFLSSDEGLREAGVVYLELPYLKTCNLGQYIEYGEPEKCEYVKELLDYYNSCEFAPAITAIGLESRFDNAYIIFYGKCKIFLGGTANAQSKLERAYSRLVEYSGESINGYMIVNVSGSDDIVSFPEKLD